MRMPKPTRESFIPKGSMKVRDKNSTAVAYIGDNLHGRGKVYAMCFAGKRAKPDRYHTYRTVEARDADVAQYFEGIQAGEANTKARAQARAEALRGVEVGDILRCSWGYEQTNIDYYEVTRLIGKRKVEIREIGADSVATGWAQGQCVPAPGSYIGEPMIKVARNGAVRIASFASAYKIEPTEVAGTRIYGASHWSAYA